MSAVEVVPQNIPSEKGALHDFAVKQEMSSQVLQELDSRNLSILEKAFPRIFLTPDQLVTHLRELRDPGAANSNSETLEKAA